MRLRDHPFYRRIPRPASRGTVRRPVLSLTETHGSAPSGRKTHELSGWFTWRDAQLHKGDKRNQTEMVLRQSRHQRSRHDAAQSSSRLALASGPPVPLLARRPRPLRWSAPGPARPAPAGWPPRPRRCRRAARRRCGGLAGVRSRRRPRGGRETGTHGTGSRGRYGRSAAPGHGWPPSGRALRPSRCACAPRRTGRGGAGQSGRAAP